MPFRIWLRLVKEQPIEEEVYLGDIPIMLGGGEFIVNGAERCVVSQLHRSPGVDFVKSEEPGERRTYSCRVIPERGSWIEFVVSKKETLGVRIDQSGRFSAMTLLRAMESQYSTSHSLLKLFYEVETSKISKSELKDLWASGPPTISFTRAAIASEKSLSKPVTGSRSRRLRKSLKLASRPAK